MCFRDSMIQVNIVRVQNSRKVTSATSSCFQTPVFTKTPAAAEKITYLMQENASTRDMHAVMNPTPKLSFW